MPVRYTSVWDAGGGGKTTVQGKWVNIPRSVEKTDTLPKLGNGTYCGFYDVAQIVYVWDGA